MRCLSTLLLAIVVACVHGSLTNKEMDEERSTLGTTRCYDNYQGQMSYYVDYSTYQSNLATSGWDNRIRSVCQTGIWFYYENTAYNAYDQSGNIMWIHGFNYCTDFSNTFVSRASSLRFGGTQYIDNSDCFTLYEHTYFAGQEYFGTKNHPSLGSMDMKASSALIVGTWPWTFYSGQSYSGYTVCAYPNTAHDQVNNNVLDMGFFAKMSALGFGDNTVRSVAKGCYGKNIVYATPLSAMHKTPTGAMGMFNATSQ